MCIFARLAAGTFYTSLETACVPHQPCIPLSWLVAPLWSGSTCGLCWDHEVSEEKKPRGRECWVRLWVSATLYLPGCFQSVYPMFFRTHSDDDDDKNRKHISDLGDWPTIWKGDQLTSVAWPVMSHAVYIISLPEKIMEQEVSYVGINTDGCEALICVHMEVGRREWIQEAGG
jgi:hypothetical protein